MPRKHYQIGLVEHVAEPGEAVREAEVIARQISSKGQSAVRRVKQVIDAGLELPLEDALNFEAEAICPKCLPVAKVQTPGAGLSC